MQLCKRENFVGTEEKSGGLGCLGSGEFLFGQQWITRLSGSIGEAIRGRIRRSYENQR